MSQSVIVEETEQADEIFDILASLDEDEGKKRGVTDKPLVKRRSGYSKWLKDYLDKKREEWGLDEKEDIQPPLPGLGLDEEDGSKQQKEAVSKREKEAKSGQKTTKKPVAKPKTTKKAKVKGEES